MTLDLATLYAEHHGASPPNEDLEIALRAVVEAGRSAWPQIALDASILVKHLAERTRGDHATLGGLHAADIFLACACKEGNAVAVAIFDRTYLARVPQFLARMHPAPDFCDDVRQILSEKLLVAAPGSAARIGEYSGRGSLAAWVRVAAVRTALDLRAIRTDEPEEKGAEVEKILATHASPELNVIRRQYARELEQALHAAFAALDPEQRLVLRLHTVKGKTGDEIASALHIHRATVVRWIARAREDILRETMRHLRAHVAGSPSELESMIVLLQSQVDVSLSQLLGRDSA